MAHDFRPPGTLEEAIDSLRARYRGAARAITPYPIQRPEPEPEPEPEPTGPLATLARGQEWLKRRGDIAQTYYSGKATGSQAMVNRALSGEPIPSEELAAGATGWLLKGEPEPGESEEERLGRAAAQEWGRHLVGPLADPTQLAVLGGIAGAAAISPVLGGVAGLGAVGMAGYDAYSKVREWLAAREEFGVGSEQEVRAKHTAMAASALAAGPLVGYGVAKGAKPFLRRVLPPRIIEGEIVPEPRALLGPGAEPGAPPAGRGPIITPPPAGPAGRGPRLLGPGPEQPRPPAGAPAAVPRAPYERPGVAEIRPAEFRDWLVDRDIELRAEGGAAAGITPATRQALLEQSQALTRARTEAMLAGVKEPRWTREAEQDLLEVIDGAQREAVEGFDRQITTALQGGDRQRAAQLMQRRLALIERLLEEEAQNPVRPEIAAPPPEAPPAAPMPPAAPPPVRPTAPPGDVTITTPRRPAGPETPAEAAARRQAEGRAGVADLLERGQEAARGELPTAPVPGGAIIEGPTRGIARPGVSGPPAAMPAAPAGAPGAPPAAIPAAPPVAPAALPVLGKVERADPTVWPVDQKWVYSEYDAQGNLLAQTPSRTKATALDRRKQRRTELKANKAQEAIRTRQERLGRPPAAPTPPAAPPVAPAPAPAPEAPPVTAPAPYTGPERRAGARERRIREEIVETERRVGEAERRLAAIPTPERPPTGPTAAGLQELGGFRVGDEVRYAPGKTGTISELLTIEGKPRARIDAVIPIYKGGTRRIQTHRDLEKLEKLEPEAPPPVKAVDKEGQALVPGFIEAAATTPEITEGRLPGEMFTPEAEAIRRREGPPPPEPEQAVIPPAVEAEIAKAEPGPAAPEAPAIKPLQPEDLTPEQTGHLDNWFAARKVEPDSPVRGEITNTARIARAAVRNLNGAEADYQNAKLLRPSVGLKQAEIQRRKRKARLNRDTYRGVYATALETLKAEVQRMGGTVGQYRRLLQVIEDRVPVREKKPAPVVLPTTTRTIEAMDAYGYLDQANVETLPERVARYRDDVEVSAPEVMREIEKMVIGLQARERAGKITATEWADALAEGVPGIGNKKAREIALKGPTHPQFEKLIAAVTRKTREQFALEEALAEDGSTRFTEAYDPEAVDVLATEMAAELAEGAPAALPWDVTNPETGNPITGAEAVDAIQSRQGRTYARILQEYQRRANDDDVPFDISAVREEGEGLYTPAPTSPAVATARAVEKLRARQMGQLRVGDEGFEPLNWEEYLTHQMQLRMREAEGLLEEPTGDYALVRQVDQLTEQLPRYENWKTWIRDNTDTVEKLFGDDARLFRVLLGVTSPATDISANVALALNAHSQMRLGVPFRGFLPSVAQNLESVRLGRVIGGAKVRPYTRALLGFEDAVWVDRWIGRYFFGDQVKQGRVTPAQARKASELMRQAAEELGWTNREVASALWAAGKIKAGLGPEEIGSYDRVLAERATAIRRFNDYFGPAAGEGERLFNAVSAVAEREGDPGAGGHGVTDHHLRAVVEPIRDLGGPLPTPEVLNHGARFGLGRLEDGSVFQPRWLGTALAKHFNERYSVQWAGLPIRSLNDLGVAAQVARNPAFEAIHFILVKKGKALFSLQHSSRIPGTTAIHPEGSPGLVRDLRNAIAATEADGWYMVHNHPSGNPKPSAMDLQLTHNIAKNVAGFQGHVVTDHQTYSTITPQDVNSIAEAAQKLPQLASAAADLITARAPAKVKDPAPDPVLAQGIQAEDYWRSEKFRIKDSAQFVQAFVGQRAPIPGRLAGRPAWPQVFFVDDGLALRGILEVHPYDFLEPKAFENIVMEAGRGIGGTKALGVVPGLSPAHRSAVARYLEEGLLADVLDPRSFEVPPYRPAVGRDIRYEKLLTPEEQATLREPPGRYPEPPPGEPEPGGAGAGGGGGGRGGTPPPATPPPDSGPWPGDDGWQSRADYSEARARAHTGEWTAGPLWDALVMGVKHFFKGLRDFGRWSGVMGALGGIGRFLGRIWNTIVNWFGERTVYQRRGRIKDIGDTEAGRRVDGGARPIRPIPRVSKEDVRRVAERLRRPPPPPRPGEKPPEFPINLDWIRDEADVKELFRVFAEVLGEQAGAAKGYRSHKRVQEMAAELGMSAEQLRRLFKKQGVLTDVQIDALRMLRQEAAIQAQGKRQVYDDLRSQLDATREPAARAALEQQLLEAERDYHAALHRAMGIWYTGIGAGSEAGRALAAHRIMAEWLAPEERAMRRLLRGLRASDEQAAALAEALAREDMAAIQRIYGQIMKPGLLRMFNEYFVNSILSGPATLMANTGGNWGHEALLRTPERGIASMLDQLGVRGFTERFLDTLPGAKVQRTGKERTAGEMAVAAKALWKYRFGLPHALRYAKEATFKDTFTLVDKEFSIPMIPGKLGRTIRTPSRWMWALDRGAKVAAEAAERAVQVHRRAHLEAERMGWGPEQIRRRVDELDADLDQWIALDTVRRSNPRGLTKEERVWMLQNKELGTMREAMRQAALKSTFQDDVMPLTKMLVQARQQHPWLTPFIPFIRTPERILVGGLKRTPMGLLEALHQMKRGKLKGGEASDRLAQGVMGTMISFAVYQMAKEGVITGGGPTDPRERSMWLKTGRVPYGFRVPGTQRWYSIARMEPLATTWGFASDMAEAQDAKTAGDFWDKLHYSVLNNITNKTYLEGIINATEAVSDPERHGAQFGKRMLGALVPNLLASAARAIDPTIRQTDDITSTLVARVPVFSKVLPARVSGTGEEISREEDPVSRFISPFRYRDEAGPERNLERLFLEMDYIPSRPPKHVKLPGTRREYMLNQEERDLYASYGRRATMFARRLTQDDDFNSLDPIQKEEMIRRIYRYARDLSRKAAYASLYRRVWRGEAEERPD